MKLASKIESILLIASKPLSLKKLAELLEVKIEEIKEALAILKEKYNQLESGIQLLEASGEIQFGTNPGNSVLIKNYIKDETTGELTRPSLEALTIIAYRGPITKLELEQIRGVNCGLILRNLLLRGLIKEEEDKTRAQLVYSVTLEFLRFLGVNSETRLPDYEKMRGDIFMKRLLDDINEKKEEAR